MAESFAPEQGSPPPNDQLSAVKVAFPQTQEDFVKDPRCAQSQLDGRWLLEDDDGQEFEWNEKVKKWTLVFDDSLKEQQQQAYAAKDDDEHTGGDNDEAASRAGTKRKVDTQNDAPSKKAKKPAPEKPNTAVYATSIPLNADADEIASVFGKYGLIAEGTDNNRHRIKMYTDKNGKFMGEALVVFFRPESVSLAIQMLDESDFRLGVTGPGGPMHVTEADRSFKKHHENQDDEAKVDGDEAFSIRKKRPTHNQKQVKAKAQKMNEKLADWSSDEDVSALPQTNPRFDKVVVLEHMFTLAEIDDDPDALGDIREDIQDEAKKLGQVTNVTVFDKDPRGAATVRFTDSRAARECVKIMHGRVFSGKSVIAKIADGSERFKKSRPEKEADGADEGEGKRIDEFGEWLEKGG